MKENLIKISHPALLNFESVKTDGTCRLTEGKIESYHEESQKKEIFALIADFGKETNFNSFTIEFNESLKNLFPDTFRIEISDNGTIWEPLIQEVDFSQSGKKRALWHFPLIKAKYIKIVARGIKSGNGHAVSFGKTFASISGIIKIDVSSEGDRLWVKENLIDGRPDYGWSSKLKDQPGEESVRFDLGSINRVEELRILSRADDATYFPENFIVYYSEDDITWSQLVEEPRFFSEHGVWYRWRFLPVNMRFMKLVSNEPKIQGRNKYATQIVEMELYASTDLVQSSDKIYTPTVPYASVLRSGLVRLAVDGEAKEGLALQSNDRRLRDATVEYKGIVELANDGEDKAFAVVQGNDKRLKYASDHSAGLIRLARSGEEKEGFAVQANDDRLKTATVTSPGIVELAESGETRPGVVVQGNDERLKKGTVKNYGLVILSENGGDKPDTVVTADDIRIKDATTERAGIARFCQDGERSGFAAVQGIDKRLKEATTESYGIVQLAKSGETKGGLVVQADDLRLKPASLDSAGVIEIAKHGSELPGKAVQADDPRLKDARIPVPHTHNYAPLHHDFGSHSGLIRIEGETGNEYSGVVPPPLANGVVYAKNPGNGAGVIGTGAHTGVSGYGEWSGLTGVSPGNAGVFGASATGFGGEFISGKNYALHARGTGNKGNYLASGKALLAEGESLFIGTLSVAGMDGTDCIARYFTIDPAEIIEPGDIVSIGEDGRIIKSRTSYSHKIIGVAVKDSGLKLGQSRTENQLLVAIAGCVEVNADSSYGEIFPGDLIVSGITGGLGVKAEPAKIRAGMLLGKSLAGLKTGRGKLLILLS